MGKHGRPIKRMFDTMTEDRHFFILKRLAEFETIPAIIAAYRAEYGETITHAIIRHYDPKDFAPNSYAKANANLFHQIRQKMIDNLERIPIANRVYRVQELQRIYGEAQENGDHATAMRAMETAAKEVGGIYTNVRRLDARMEVENLSDDELHNKLVQFFGDAASIPSAVRPLVIEHQPEEEDETAD